jgi:hypothetical protein
MVSGNSLVSSCDDMNANRHDGLVWNLMIREGALHHGTSQVPFHEIDSSSFPSSDLIHSLDAQDYLEFLLAVTPPPF